MIRIMSILNDLFSDARSANVSVGQVLFRRNDLITSAVFIQDGSVALERPLRDGGHLTLHIATSGMLLAEASLFAEHYHCDAVVRADGLVRSLGRDVLMARLVSKPTAMLEMSRIAAIEAQALRGRIELLRLRRLSDRLDGWLDLHGPPGTGGWKTVADGIGVTPAALYRELARRRE